MGLKADNFNIALTPSGILDGHFPDGNDGSGTIPLTWATVPDFTGNQVGTPLSVDLFGLYLTQAGGAVASLHSGALSGGWALASNGTLSWDGTGVASGTIQVRATISGHAPSDSNFFNFQSIAVIVSADTLAPTIPTGLAFVSKTSTTITVGCDAPSDVPTATIPASGMKEVRFFKNGAFDGVTAVTGGKSVLLTEADIGAGSGRRYVGDWYLSISWGARNKAGGLPNAGTVSDAGPICADVKGATFRYNWNDLETAPNVFSGIQKIVHDLAQCHAMGIMYFAIIIVRTFDGNNPMPGAGLGPPDIHGNPTDIDLALKTYTFTNPLGKVGYQGWRWDPVVLNRFNALVKGIGAFCDSDAYFGGIGTQETAIGTPTPASGYTLTSFVSALKSEGDFIAHACPKSRHLWFFNDIHGGGKTDLGGVAAYLQNNGAIIANPDLVLGGPITTNVYPICTDYLSGIGKTANGTQALTGSGAVAESIQHAEWTNQTPANNPAGTLLQRYEYAVAASAYPSSPLKVPIIITDWGSDGNGAGFSGANGITPVIHAHPTLITYTPTGSLVPGSLAQTGVDYNITGAGTGIGSASDQWSAGRTPQPCNGDFSLIAELAGIVVPPGGNASLAFAGISIREALTPLESARAAHLFVTSTAISSKYRAGPSGAMTSVTDVAGLNWSSPKWLKVTRAGNLFSFFYSTNTAIGNYDPAFTPQASDFYYVDLNAPINGNGLTPATPKNVLPSTTVSGMQLLFNADNGIQTISPIENALLMNGSNIQISSYSASGAGRAVVSGFAKITSGWTVFSGNVYSRAYAGALDAQGRRIVGCVVDMNNTTESPQGTVLKWNNVTVGGFSYAAIPSNSSAYDFTNGVMYVNLGGTDPNTHSIGISSVSRFLTVLSPNAPSKFTIHGLRLIGFARAVTNIVQGSNLGHVTDLQLYANGYMWVSTQYFGSGIQISNTANNIEVNNNLIEQTGDSPITPQHFALSTGGNLNNIHIHHNTVSKWGLSAVEMSDFGSGNATSNITVEYNVMTGGGAGYSGSGHEAFTDGPHLRGANGNFTNIVIQNNTIQSLTNDIAFHGGTSTNPCTVTNNRLSSSLTGYFNQVPTTIHANVTNNLLCANATDLIPSTAGAGSTYVGNTSQGGECYVTPRTGEGIQLGFAWTAAGTANISMSALAYPEVFPCSGTPTTVTAQFKQINIQSLAGVSYVFTGLSAGAFTLSAVSRDQAGNDSMASTTVSVTIP